MMLEQPGQVSAPLRSPYGLHLVQYIGDVTPGEVPLAEVSDAVAAEALKHKQNEYYEQQRDALLEAAQVKYYPERLR
jgi:parvulin-like peptidyl-prolyl isomerase